jgi:hypothetical protein
MVGKANKLFFNFFFKDRLLKRLLQEKNCPFTPLLKLRILPADDMEIYALLHT